MYARAKLAELYNKLIIYLLTLGSEEAMPRYKPLRLDDNMPFGKYKGFTIREIIEMDSQYFNWLKNKTDVQFDLSPSKPKSKLASLDQHFKNGKYKGCTIAEVIRCNPDYIRKNMKGKLDSQAEYYLDHPKYALKGLLQIVSWKEPFISEDEMVKEAIYLRNGMNYMTSLQVTNPVF